MLKRIYSIQNNRINVFLKIGNCKSRIFTMLKRIYSVQNNRTNVFLKIALGPMHSFKTVPNTQNGA